MISSRARGRTVKARRHDIGKDLDFSGGGGKCLIAVIEHLNAGSDRHRDEKRDDQYRHGAAQHRLCDEKPAVGRLCNGLSQPLDRIRTH